MVNESVGGAHINHRMCAQMRLMLSATANAAAAPPKLLPVATYAALDTIARGDAPQALASGIWIYRPYQSTKICALTFLSDTGGDGETCVYDIMLYPRIQPSASSGDVRYQFGKRHRVTLTLGTTTEANITYEPFTGSNLGGAKTLRHYDTAAWSYRDTGDLQVYDKGFDTVNGSGTIYVDMSCWDTLVVGLITKPASSARELIGLAEECA